MHTKQVVLNVPEWVYKELDKLSKHKIERYLVNLVQKLTSKAKKSSISNIFDVFDSKKLSSSEHDKYIYK